jgi:hypothetical protein
MFSPFEHKAMTSSLSILSDCGLLKLHSNAVKASADPEFIQWILQEINRRHLTIDRDKTNLI